jgi:iron complex outermembrane receptor protein
MDEIGSSDQIMLAPEERTIQLGSFLVQDEIILVPDQLRLTLGSKFEHNSFTGFEVQPSGRLLWTPHPRHAFWSSVSRAVRTPSRIESDGRLRIRVDPPSAATGGLPVAYEARGDSGFDSETLLAYELGYRVQPIDRVSLDLALFYNDYDDLRSLEQQPTGFETEPTPHIVVPLVAGNRMYGESYGVELAANYRVSTPWRLQASYSFIQMQLHLKPGSTDPFSTATERQTPHHQFGLRSFLDLPHHFELDAGIRYVDNLPGHGIPSYLVLDARIGWRPSPNWELSLVGRNWLDSQHPEFPGSELVRTRNTEVQHSIHGIVTWMF